MQGSAGKVKSRICKRSELKPVIAQVTATYTATGSEHVLSLSTSANLCSQHRSENPGISYQYPVFTNKLLLCFCEVHRSSPSVTTFFPISEFSHTLTYLINVHAR